MDDNKDTLAILIEEFLRAIPAAAECINVQLKPKDSENLVKPEAFEALESALDRVKKIMRFMGCLLNLSLEEGTPDPFTPQDVLWLVGYKGKIYPEKSLNEAIQANVRLQQLCDEVVRTATSSVKLQPEKERLQESMDGMFTGHLPVTTERLQAIVTTLPGLRKGLRQSDMEKINHTATLVLSRVTEDVLHGNMEARSVTTRFVTFLLEAIALYHDRPGMTDLHDKLHQWVSAHRMDTAMSDLADLAKQWSETGLSDLEEAQQIMSKLQRTKIDKDNWEQRWAAMAMLVTSLRSYNAEVGGQNKLINSNTSLYNCHLREINQLTN